jgi:hypothetical protein
VFDLIGLSPLLPGWAIEPLQIQFVERFTFGPRLDRVVDASTAHDLAGLGFAARRRGEVGDAADRGGLG